MLFRTLTLAALAACTAAQAIGADKLISNMERLSSMSDSSRNLAKTIGMLNGFETGPELINTLHQLVRQGTKDFQELYELQVSHAGEDLQLQLKRSAGGSVASRAMRFNTAESKFTQKEQLKVCDAMLSFSKSQREMLNEMIGKHGILEVTGVAYQMAAVTRGVEGVIDEIYFTVMGWVPVCISLMQETKKSHDSILQKAIDTYAGGLP